MLDFVFRRQYHYTHIRCVVNLLQFRFQLWPRQDHSQNYHHGITFSFLAVRITQHQMIYYPLGNKFVLPRIEEWVIDGNIIVEWVMRLQPF